MCKNIQQCKVFFSNLSVFSVFFTSPKRASPLKEYDSARVPRAAQTRWNFNSQVVNTIYENRNVLLKCLTGIHDGLPEHEPTEEEDAPVNLHILILTRTQKPSMRQQD